ncbi:MAG: hydroxyethylthiazole kinase [Methanomassiliicoccaceae archaeon]|jgi:hydroxyethylthiazole kinase|nr:hydroxyethylthiazole kinase [Methanomassiliicoccaceae archaeon]
MKNETARLMKRVRETRPLVHQITNNVTVNDCANITLCAGGSPVMSDSADDVEDMVKLASSLVLNIGTLNDEIVRAMIIAGKAANELGKPVILDPVGAGATGYRMRTIDRLLSEIRISIIKGNAGEIGALAGAGGKVRGVDSGGLDGDPVEACIALSKRTGATVVMTGAVDIITDGRRVAAVNNGHEMMSSISGTGCMSAAVIGCYAACTDDMLTASAAALAVFCIAGNKAAKRSRGPGTFIMNLKDEMANMTENEVVPLANIRLL